MDLTRITDREIERPENFSKVRSHCHDRVGQAVGHRQRFNDRARLFLKKISHRTRSHREYKEWNLFHDETNPRARLGSVGRAYQTAGSGDFPVALFRTPCWKAR